MNSYSHKYKSISDFDLFKVILNSSEYNPEAIEAARTEVEFRQWSKEKLNALRAQYELEKEQQASRGESIVKIKNIGSVAMDSIYPVSKSSKFSVEKSIIGITVFFALSTLHAWYNQFAYAKFLLTDRSSTWDLYTFMIMLPLLLIPIGTILFWRGNIKGWIILFSFIIYSVISNLYLLETIWEYEPNGISSLDLLFTPLNPTIIILYILLLTGLIWLFTKKELKTHFKISKRTFIRTIIGAAIYSFFAVLGS